MGEKFTSRVGTLIRNFRIAADMTQKELAEKCGLNESTIRNYELGNRYPDEATLLNIANHLGVSFFALSDPDVANIFSALHVLFNIEWAYGLRPTIKDSEVVLKFENRLSCTGPRPQEDLDSFKKMVEYWARLRDKLEDGEITESDYYKKEIRFPANPIDSDASYSVSLNLADDDQMMVQEMLENEEVAEALKVIPKPVDLGTAVSEAEKVQEEVKIEEISEAQEAEKIEEKKVEKVVEAPKEKVAEKKVVSQVVDIEETKPISELVDMYEENNKAEEYEKSIMFEKKPSLWQKFKKSKFARAISYVFKIRIRIELPNALPEGRGE